MATELELKKRIGSVKNISKVTNALSAVSAAKARRYEKQVGATRDYAGKAFEILNNLAAKAGDAHPLLRTRDNIRRTGIVLMTSDRGLCGAYNTNAIRLAENFANSIDTPVEIIAVGRKGRDSMIRRGYEVAASFTNLASPPSLSTVTPIARVVTEDYLSEKYDQIFIIYTDFINLASSKATVKQLLPLKPLNYEGMALAEYLTTPEEVSEAQGAAYSYEPGPEELIGSVVPRFTELQMYQAFLESLASEESSRFMAMQNATDNATTLVDALVLERNKVRQTNITNEILDIVGGAEALSQ